MGYTELRDECCMPDGTIVWMSFDYCIAQSLCLKLVLLYRVPFIVNPAYKTLSRKGYPCPIEHRCPSKASPTSYCAISVIDKSSFNDSTPTRRLCGPYHSLALSSQLRITKRLKSTTG